MFSQFSLYHETKQVQIFKESREKIKLVIVSTQDADSALETFTEVLKFKKKWREIIFNSLILLSSRMKEVLQI